MTHSRLSLVSLSARLFTGLATCALLATPPAGAWADPSGTIEVIKGTKSERVRPGQVTGERASGEAASDARELPRVEVFLTDWCPYCRRLEAFLKENQIPYERKNIEEQPDYRQQYAALGGGGIPVTRIGGRDVVRGFRPDEIGRLLGLEPR